MALPSASSAPPPGFTIISTSGRASKGTFGTVVRIEGLKAVQNGLRALGVSDVPYVRAALVDIGTALAIGMSAVAPFPSFKVGAPRVLGKVPALRVSVPMQHPGARSREFGRKYYYRGFTGRAARATGYKFASSPGQVAKPYLGVISGNSVAEAVRPYAEKRLVDAYIKEWETANAAVSNDVIEVGG